MIQSLSHLASAGIPLLDDTIDKAKQMVGPATKASWWEDRLETLLILLVVIVATLFVLRVGRRLLLSLQRSRNIPDAAMLPIRKALRWLVIVLAALVTMQLLGVPMSVIWASASTIAALVAIGFVAVWSMLSNITASFLLLIFKPFRIGDYVEFADTSGEGLIGGRVVDITLMYVTLREDDGENEPAFVQIPNNMLFQKPIRRRSGKRVVPLDEHYEKHGATGREQEPPATIDKPA